MGKFDGILLCTDLDGTLLNDKRLVSPENAAAVEYFKSEGGKFTFVTGRVPKGAKLMLEFVKPNTPVVVFNGAGIYDFEDDKLLWGLYLDENAINVVKYVEARTNNLGLVVCADSNVYFPKINRWVDDYYKSENMPLDTTPYTDITEPWKKALFIAEDFEIPNIRKIIADSEYKDKYEFVQSSPYYYELLPPMATKGNGLIRLAELVGVSKDKIIAVGDNENDISMLKTAKIGIAVANASDEVKKAATLITSSNNEHAISKVIEMLDNGEIEI